MIDKESLRIGNYVEHFGDIVKVMLIAANENYSCRDSFMINIDGEFGCIYADPEETNPIPLTEAVLMAAGFEKDEYGFVTMEDGRFYMSFDMEENNKSMAFRTDIGMDLQSVCNTTSVDYLHQLQNLIFCLRGMELKINLKELKKTVG